jgi:DNA-directed RNA polymerase subunit M/transcription elongation factor TFIIS
MQFCPKCDNIMDIGKSAPKVSLAIATPNTISSETKTNEDEITKLIQLYKNGDDISNFNIDIKLVTASDEFKKLKDTQQKDLLKVLKSSEIDESLSAFRICKNCSYFERLVGRNLVLSRMSSEASISGIVDLSKYKYMIHDKTLPHTRDYLCKNDKCESHKNHDKRNAVWFRPVLNSYSTYYGCVTCGEIWNIS